MIEMDDQFWSKITSMDEIHQIMKCNSIILKLVKRDYSKIFTIERMWVKYIIIYIKNATSDIL